MARGDTCSICGKPARAGSPFCGQGCRDRDLLRWLGDGYRLPVVEHPDPGEDAGDDGLDSPRNPD